MFIAPAYADSAAAAAQAPSFVAQILPLVVIFALFWLLIIRPQQKKAKEHQSMLQALQKGDEVVVGGTVAKIVKISDAYVTVEVADGVEVLVQRGAIGQKLEKGTIKNNK
ncbi:preprotein translocase subunit YajC [Chitinilyticum piscinae]|uniref:Sec translocon accessory complex subunit YajC n=1 Tax=Chitinilyticum piscinae TaxID=2866724 RepID=A0A8J7G2C5_9NEIS|nr:preprotein translocase subunit YajC [Chitinilyticum piscinae]MBE9610133.1 preprotein translocase subunit YajC [Chitinilyticum piscinae]